MKTQFCHHRTNELTHIKNLESKIFTFTFATTAPHPEKEKKNIKYEKYVFIEFPGNERRLFDFCAAQEEKRFNFGFSIPSLENGGWVKEIRRQKNVVRDKIPSKHSNPPPPPTQSPNSS